jgi:tetratricopeptide (TPR) repeat protein
MAAAALGRREEALHDYSQALEREPGFAAARLNRGILSFHMGRQDDAILDLRRALNSASDRTIRGRIYYNLSLVELAVGDRLSARDSAEQAIALGEKDARAVRDRLRDDR